MSCYPVDINILKRESTGPILLYSPRGVRLSTIQMPLSLTLGEASDMEMLVGVWDGVVVLMV
jgi:hypothetical protein